MSDELLEMLTTCGGSIRFQPANPGEIIMSRFMGKWHVNFFGLDSKRQPVFEGEDFSEALAAVKAKLDAEQ